MLSEQEYEDTIQQLNNLTSTRKSTKTLRKSFQKKLKEHEYASTYIAFEPLPHIPFFINRTTTEPILRQIIQAATTSNEFIIDTESINIYRVGNEPALIQCQIMLPHDYSLALIIEMCHLPNINNICFTLIKELFRIIFSPNKTCYIWGSKEELIPFITFSLFSKEQINDMYSINLQNEFKHFWEQQQPHQSNSSLTSTLNNCICEQCLGRNTNELWSLQDAVAYELKKYLSKQLTMGDFSIGLDTNLHHLNQEEKNHRQQLTKYAFDDCFSMHNILINMKNKKFKFSCKIKIPYDLMESISSDDDDEILFSQVTPSVERLENHKKLNINEQEQLTSTSAYENSNWKINSTNDKQSTNQQQPQTTQSQYRHEGERGSHPAPEHTQQLSAEARKKIHNRKCTIKQRRRYYKNEIIIKNIDKRFTIKEIKDILKYKKISFYAVKPFTSSFTNECTLFIGIRDKTKLSLCQHETKHLFTSSHFRQFQHMKQQITHHYRNNQRQHEH